MNRCLCWMTALIVFIGTATANAGFKTTVHGVTVAYSGSGDAYYDSSDGTLTIEIYDSGGALKVTVGSTAPAFWGDYVDIYLLADDVALKSINIKGTTACTPFVVGQVGYVKKFTLFGGVVGNTDAYGLDFGLGMVSSTVPVACNLRFSYTTAQLLGYEYTLSGTLAKERSLSAASTDKQQLLQKIQKQLAAPNAATR